MSIIQWQLFIIIDRLRLVDTTTGDGSLGYQAWALMVGWVTAPWLKNPERQWYEAWRSCMVLPAKKGWL